MILENSLVSLHNQLEVSVGSSIGENDSLVGVRNSSESGALVDHGNITEDLDLALQL